MSVIPELKRAIENGMQAVASFKHRPGLLECEDYVYSEMEFDIKVQAQAEISKAKSLMKSRKGWRWLMFKESVKSPIRLLFAARALWNNLKRKLWRRT
jgi:hypothetical protein